MNFNENEISRIEDPVANALRSGTSISNLWHGVEICVTNSIEAGATEIHCELDVASCAFQVKDNGRGLSLGALRAVGIWNTSSKLEAGARGEGLASVCSVAVVEVTSRPSGSFETHSCLLRAGSLLQMRLAPEQRPRAGTVVSVKDAFFNRPVARKMLLAAGVKKEVERCCRAIDCFALLHPHVTFTLYDRASRCFAARHIKGRSQAQSVGAFFGSPPPEAIARMEAPGNLLSFSAWNVSGWAARPPHGHPTSARQRIYIDGRPVKAPPLSKAIDALFVDIQREMLKQQGRGQGQQLQSVAKASNKHAMFVLQLRCTEGAGGVEVLHGPGGGTVLLHDWAEVLAAVRSAVLAAWRPVLTSALEVELQAAAAAAAAAAGPAAETLQLADSRSFFLSKGAAIARWSGAGGLGGGGSSYYKGLASSSSAPGSLRAKPAAAAMQSGSGLPSLADGGGLLPGASRGGQSDATAGIPASDYQAGYVERPPSFSFSGFLRSGIGGALPHAKPQQLHTAPSLRPASSQGGSLCVGQTSQQHQDPQQQRGSLLDLTPLTDTPGAGTNHPRQPPYSSLINTAASAPPMASWRQRRERPPSLPMPPRQPKNFEAWDASAASGGGSGTASAPPMAKRARLNPPPPSSTAANGFNVGASALDAILSTWSNPAMIPAGNAFSSTEVASVDSLAAAVFAPLRPERLAKADLQGARALRQIGAKFVPIVCRGGILALVDQHAADERVQLERLRAQVLDSAGMPAGGAAPSLPLDVPQSLRMGADEAPLLEEYACIAAAWGWRWNHHNTAATNNFFSDFSLDVEVVGVPVVCGRALTATDLRLYLHELGETRGAPGPPSGVVRVLNSRACRSAIMFGNELLPAECQGLVEGLQMTQLCFICAHGRPTTVPLVDLEALRKAAVVQAARAAQVGKGGEAMERPGGSLAQMKARLVAALKS